MAEINIEKMAHNVAEKALDEILYQGKSIREWMQIIASEDYISRQEVLDILKDKWNMFSDANDVIQESIDTIEALPPVTPQQRIGHWEWIQYDGNPNIGNWHCSECNRIVRGAITVVSPVYSYKYCPNCGAKMVEPQESEEI